MAFMIIVGRKEEKDILDTVLESSKAEFIALYGRRRIGKTYLIREYLEPNAGCYFEATGQLKSTIKMQLWHFKSQLEKSFYGGAPLPNFSNWHDAFNLLADAVDNFITENKNKKVVIFLDELPWMSTKRSGLVPALDLIWNTRLSRRSNVILVVCGSASSWIIEHLIQGSGGLHNRVTKRIQLQPFTLNEVMEFFDVKKIRFSLHQIIELYMAIGGVAFYLNEVVKGKSTNQIIASLCFDKNGILNDEFDRLFDALFAESNIYEKIIKIIASKRYGITRKYLIEKLSISKGGRVTKRIKELEEAGFISISIPYGEASRNTNLQIVDPFIFFHCKWIDKAPSGMNRKQALDYWHSMSSSQSYESWSGFSFELLLVNHKDQVRKALGIEHIHAVFSSWSHRKSKGAKESKGTQIDLVIDRNDNLMSLCEVKYSNTLFSITKEYSEKLVNKMDIFNDVIKPNKPTQLVLITLKGTKKNKWYTDVIDVDITAEQIFCS